MKPNRKYKDGIFRAYFKDIEKLKSLYCALSGMNPEDIESIELATLIHQIRIRMADGTNLDTAIREAIKYCKSHDIMVEFLEEYGKEAETMLNTEITREEWGRIIAEDKLAEGIAIGKAEGVFEGKMQSALNLKTMGVPTDIISKATGLSIEEIENL